jgi:hypothetical protein
MKTENQESLNQSKLGNKFKTDVIRRYFRDGLWQKLFLVSIIEIIGHIILIAMDNDFTSLKILHLIGWSIWSAFCLIKVVRFNRYNDL